VVMDVIRSKLIGEIGRGSADNEAGLSSQCDAVADDFDTTFYAVRYPEVGGDLLRHYMSEGWREGKDPAPWFSTSFYVDANPDVANAGLNPFYHYVRHGRSEGRLVAPAEYLADDRSWEVDAIRGGIDEAFYSQQLRRAGIDPTGIDIALHYWREGANLGLDPAEDFSTSHYVEAHADVVAAGVNPFAHYLEQGRNEGRTSQAAKVEQAADTQVDRGGKKGRASHDRGLAASGFDPEYYLAANPDVAAAGVDPLDHFLSSGWREGRNPNLWFSVAHYLDFYPDVAAAGINPFLHYLMAGKSEGRLPRHDLGFRYDIISSLQPLDERIRQARAWALPPEPSAAEKLGAALRGAKRLETKGLYLSVSHDDFTENVGGVQLVLMRESAAVDEMGFDHLHLFPTTVISVADLDTKDPVLGVLLNRRRVGFFRASDIERELGKVAPRLRSRPFVLHSLIRHNADALLSILKAAGCRSGWYWVHDYSSICTGYTLLRNDVEFCGAPSPTSSACSICVYGGLRVKQVKAHERLFNELDLTVLAPSDAALDVWKAGTSITAPAYVHQHLRIAVSKKSRSKKAQSSDRPLRIAYIGQAVSHKGWLAFRDLALKFGKDPRYEFYHIGKEPSPGVPVIFREVAVGADDLDKMVRTLGELKIDVALLWSLWPETFCIAAVEALRAGSAVITFKDSGNVAAMVKETGFGAVLESEDELERLFETGEVIKLAAKARPTGMSATFSNMTADFIEEKVEGKAA
jgi:hypothetical protein